MTDDHTVSVTSHVARDLLQNAALFKTDRLVVWEYVSNGLQYVEPGVNPVVRVSLDNKTKTITITDNARGMDLSGLQNFFIMHGENIDRQQGRPGRGRFGTGKSAAFGIADRLTITTVKDHELSQVVLERSGIERLSSGSPIPVQILQKEKPTQDTNGTIIQISKIHLRSLDQEGVVKYIERHLSKWSKNATVYVNNHPCEYYEPPVSQAFELTPTPEVAAILGPVRLAIKVSKVPLDPDLRGISIYSKGIWYETTLAGSETRDMSQYIFGEIDVPALDDDSSPIPAFDMSRSMKLNPSNALVSTLYSFLGENIDRVRRQLVDLDKKNRKAEETKRLESEAQKISDIINEDFLGFRSKLAKAKAAGGIGADYQRVLNGNNAENDQLRFGNEFPAQELPLPDFSDRNSTPTQTSSQPREFPPLVAPAADDEPAKGKQAAQHNKRTVQRGGFRVDFQSMGFESDRAKYVSENRTIYINLDHPQLSAARTNLTIDDPSFKRLAYEIAFTEYAIALAYELVNSDNYLDLTDPVYDIRQTVNRIARKAASLYS